MLLPWLGPAVLLASWSTAVAWEWVPASVIPAPQQVFHRGVELFIDDQLVLDMVATLKRWCCGFIAGMVLGLSSGLLLGINKWLYDGFAPLFDALRSTPVTALLPLFLVVFGVGDSAKVAMAAVATAPVVLLHTAYGVRQVSPARKRMMRAFGASRWQSARWVVVWEALPAVVTGIRTGVSLSLVVIIVSEMFIGSELGLGRRIFDAYTLGLSEEMMAVVFVVGVVGYVANRICVAVENKLLFWVAR